MTDKRTLQERIIATLGTYFCDSSFGEGVASLRHFVEKDEAKREFVRNGLNLLLSYDDSTWNDLRLLFEDDVNVTFDTLHELRAWLEQVKSGFLKDEAGFLEMRAEEAQTSVLQVLRHFLRHPHDDKGIEVTRAEVQKHNDLKDDFQRGIPALISMEDDRLVALVSRITHFYFEQPGDARKWLNVILARLTK